MHKVKKYIAEDLKFSNQTIKEMKINSKKFYNKIKERRSIREFSKDKIDINIIKNAILSAGSAPSGANLQPWHFVVIKNKTVKKKIRIEAEKEEENFYKYKAPQEWLDALTPLGTDENKKLLCKRVCRYSYWYINYLFTFFWLSNVNTHTKSNDIS